MERDWIVGLFTLAGVFLGGGLGYLLRRFERRDERNYEDRKRRIARLEELHFAISELMALATNFAIQLQKFGVGDYSLEEHAREGQEMNAYLQPFIAKAASLQRLSSRSLEDSWVAVAKEIDQLRISAGAFVAKRIDNAALSHRVLEVHRKAEILQGQIEELLADLDGSITKAQDQA